MDAGGACVSEQRHESWFAFTLLVFGDAAIVHALFESHASEHLRLRQTQSPANLEQLVSEAQRLRTRIAHQQPPPLGSRLCSLPALGLVHAVVSLTRTR